LGPTSLTTGKHTVLKREKLIIVRLELKRRRDFIRVGEGLVDNSTNTGFGRVMLTKEKADQVLVGGVITVVNDGSRVKRIRIII
jgi:hypothetical protein